VARLLISYDLRKPNYDEEDYQALYSALKKMHAKRIQESVWAVQTNANPTSVFDRLSPLMHENDRLLVARIGAFKNFQGITLLKGV